VNPNLFTQDCVLVFVALAALWPLPRRLALPAIVGTVALVDLILLDQAAITVHVFTIALVALVVLACLRAPRRPRRAHSPAAPVAPAGPISAGAGTRRP
jgi:hypothetical protein